jgi:hypothetical protein
VDVQDLEAPPKTDNGSGFDKLVLSPDHKQILQSQVHEHFRKRGLQVLSGSTEDDMDLVRGKGQGLIILLHGKTVPVIVPGLNINDDQAPQESVRRAQQSVSPSW